MQMTSHNMLLRILVAALAIGGATTTFTTTATAAPVGNDPSEPGGWDFGSDGHNVLDMQLQNPITQAGSALSFSFFTGAAPGGFTPPFVFHAYIFRPTGTPNEYSILFDSGTLDMASFPDNTVQTIAIAPVAVQPGDVIGHWGRGIGFDLGTTGEDTWFYNGGEFTTPQPLGTFTAPGPSYNPGGAGNREYALQFEVPEPACLGSLTLIGALAIRRRGRQD